MNSSFIKKILLPQKLLCFGISIVIILFDLWSKNAIKIYLNTQPLREKVLINDFMALVYRHNTGGAFSILDQFPALFLYLPSVLILIVFGLLLSLDPRRAGPWLMAGLSLVLGGAMGNMIDRIKYGHVFDFIDCYVGNAHWPAFNAADSCIVIGVSLIAVSILRGGVDDAQ